MIKSTTYTLLIILILFSTIIYTREYFVKKINIELKKNTYISSFKDFSCTIKSPNFNCSLNQPVFNYKNNKISIKKININALSLYSIIKLMNKGKKRLFIDNKRYKINLNFEDVKINGIDFSILGIKDLSDISIYIKNDVQSIGNNKAINNLQIEFYSNKKHILNIFLELNLTNENFKIEKIIIIEKRKKIINQLYEKYKIVEQIKNKKNISINADINTIKRLIKKRNLTLDDINSIILKKTFKGENFEQKEIQIKKN